MENKYHQDCENYLPIDVFKGICSRSKDTIIADDDACDEFDPMKKCKLCRHFSPEQEYLGLCMGKTMVYPDLSAKTCNDFEWGHE